MEPGGRASRGTTNNGAMKPCGIYPCWAVYTLGKTRFLGLVGEYYPYMDMVHFSFAHGNLLVPMADLTPAFIVDRRPLYRRIFKQMKQGNPGIYQDPGLLAHQVQPLTVFDLCQTA